MAELLASGYAKRYSERLEVFGTLPQVGKHLPVGSKVLVHEFHLLAGLQRSGVSDWVGWQGALSYGRARSPSELYDQLTAYGVTHVLWLTGLSRRCDSVAGDLKFFWFATRNTGET